MQATRQLEAECYRVSRQLLHPRQRVTRHCDLHVTSPDAVLPASMCSYMLLSAAGLAILAINRVGADPPFLWAVGMISCLSYGIVVNAVSARVTLSALGTLQCW
jgi:hypothetical protein